MRILRRAFQIIAITSLILAGACVSQRHQTAAVPSATNSPLATSTARPQRLPLNEILQQAAAKPSQRFDGEGWQKMFDEQTLTGWRETDFAGRGEVKCQFGLMILNTG